MYQREKEWGRTGIIPRIAVVIPCFNEQRAVGQVVRGFRDSLPNATVYVYDNNSTDKTIERATEAGAIVRRETRQGKGNVVRRMFCDVEADVYVLADGDGTYDSSQAPQLVAALIDGPCDMVTAVRDLDNCPTYSDSHRFGTKAFGWVVDRLFGGQTSDIFSGYRVFSRRFVKSFPMMSSGFEIETELTIHALELRMKTCEVKSRYTERESGSSSKLHGFRDGFKILRTVLTLVKEERPLFLFSSIFGVLALTSIGLAVPIIQNFVATGLVPRFPTVILGSALMLLSFLSLTAGFVLSSVTNARREMKRLSYLTIPAPGYPKEAAVSPFQLPNLSYDIAETR